MNRLPLVTIPSRIFYEIVKANIDINVYDTVLDAGTGTGYSALKFSYVAREVLAVDISRPSIDFLRSHVEREGLIFQCADLCNKRYALRNKGRFTKIFSTDVLEHVEEPEEFLKCISSMLTDNGLFCATFPCNPDHGRNYYSKIEEIINIFDGANLSVLSLRVIHDAYLLKYLSHLFRIAKRKFMTRMKSVEIKTCDANEFSETLCFQIQQQRKNVHILMNILFRMMISLAKIFPLFKYEYANNNNILHNRIVIIAQKKTPASGV